MNRRTFCNLAGAMAVWPLVTAAQTGERIFRIGWLREGANPLGDSFWESMRKLGWIEGKNVMVESRYAKAADQLPILASELAQLNVDLILTDGTPATRAAKGATATIPIVFSIGADPVFQGFVSSLARPGGNLTGFTFGSYDDKQLQLLKEALPGISRVAYPQEVGPTIMRAAATLGLEVLAIPTRGPDDLESFFKTARSRGAQAVVFPNLAWTGPNEKRIAAEASKASLPLIGTWRSFAEDGALMSYGPQQPSYRPRSAAQVDKILRGAKPSDIPVESPTKFDLAVNLRTAKALGLRIPHSISQRADHIVR
jgi:putative tryptophan/tyrosine transport system substrate-binding protein